MRTITVAVLLCLSVAVMADQSKFRNKLTSMLTMKAKAADAVDAALGVLKDLKQANYDAQAAADALNKTQEEACHQEVADLTDIANSNKAIGNDATSNRKGIEQKIADDNSYIDWIHGRRDDIHRRRAELEEQRCYSNNIFVHQLKEHDDALEVIRMLRDDLLPFAPNQESAELAQITDVTSKLKAYTHLFNEQALQEFAQLSQEDETAEWDDRADDNNRAGLDLEDAVVGTEERNLKGGLGGKLLDMLEKLEQHLHDSINKLESDEIQAAWDLATWLQDSENELRTLDDTERRLTNEVDKLEIALVAATAHEDKAWEIYFDSATSLNNAIDECNNKRAAYAEDHARRDEENAVLDEVIRIFIEKVSSMDDSLRDRVNDFIPEELAQKN